MSSEPYELLPQQDNDLRVYASIYVGPLTDRSLPLHERRRLQLTTPDGYFTLSRRQSMDLVGYILRAFIGGVEQ